MDAVSYAHSAKQAQRIEKFIENPDSTSGVVTVPKVIASGETITIPAGRVAILPNVQIDGVLNVENGGEVFIPSGATFGRVVEKVTSTDNAIVRFDGTTGAVQNSGVIIDDNGNVGIGDSNPLCKLSIKDTALPDMAGSKITSLAKCIDVGSNASYLLLSTVRTSTGIGHITTEERIQKVIDNTEMGYISFGLYNVKFGISGYEKVLIDEPGNLLLTSGTGGLGYGTGSGGTVTQLTSKSTSVTLNKPTGGITMHNASLAAGAYVEFLLNNTSIQGTDTVELNIIGGLMAGGGSYSIYRVPVPNGCYIGIRNETNVSLSDSITIKFNVFKGADS